MEQKTGDRKVSEINSCKERNYERRQTAQKTSTLTRMAYLRLNTRQVRCHTLLAQNTTERPLVAQKLSDKYQFPKIHPPNGTPLHMLESLRLMGNRTELEEQRQLLLYRIRRE